MPHADPPHVALITAHDLGRHLGCYGIDEVESPNLDGLAADGVQCLNAVATSPVCSPARGSLLTGRYPQSNGLLGLTHSPWWWRIDAGERTLPERLAAAGYETHLAGLQHVAPEDDRLGFDYRHAGPRDAAGTAAAAETIFADADGPTYAQFGFFETHRPFDREPEREVHVPSYLEPTDEMRADLGRFQAEIAHLDERIGELLGGLEAAGVREDTIVVFAVDHGIPYPGAKWWCRDPGVGVALLMDLPGVPARTVEPVVSTVDVVPTILEAIGMPIPERVEGTSLHPYLRGDTNEAPRQAAFTQFTSAGSEARGVVTEAYTCIRNFGAGRTIAYPTAADPTVRAGENTGEPRPYAQLYDRTKDPANLEDLGNERPALVRRLSEDVRRWMARVDDPLLRGGVRYPYHERALADLHGANE